MIKYIKKFGIALLLTSTLVYCYNFFLAYFSPAKAVLITINESGEANFEMFVMLPLTLIFGIWSFLLVIREK